MNNVMQYRALKLHSTLALCLCLDLCSELCGDGYDFLINIYISRIHLSHGLSHVCVASIVLNFQSNDSIAFHLTYTSNCSKAFLVVAFHSTRPVQLTHLYPPNCMRKLDVSSAPVPSSISRQTTSLAQRSATQLEF